MSSVNPFYAQKVNSVIITVVKMVQKQKKQQKQNKNHNEL